jgi:hypothetical protein
VKVAIDFQNLEICRHIPIQQVVCRVDNEIKAKLIWLMPVFVFAGYEMVRAKLERVVLFARRMGYN